jgi:hypothetical protein
MNIFLDGVEIKEEDFYEPQEKTFNLDIETLANELAKHLYLEFNTLFSVYYKPVLKNEMLNITFVIESKNSKYSFELIKDNAIIYNYGILKTEDSEFLQLIINKIKEK